VVKTFSDDNIANAWLLNPKIFRLSKYMRAFKMRENSTGTKEAFTRAIIKGNIACRKCLSYSEGNLRTYIRSLHTYQGKNKKAQ
jgi:hypothetical protein